MQKTHRNPIPVTLALAALAAGAAPGCIELDDDPVDEVTATDEHALLGGTYTTARPEIGRIYLGPTCTGTLIDPRLVLTSARCIGFANANVYGLFEITSATGATSYYTIDKTFTLGTWYGIADVGLARLTIPVPASVATPTYIWPYWPSLGVQQTMFGYGCQDRTVQVGGGAKQYFTSLVNSGTSAICPGDNGGPVTWYGPGESGPVFAINSTYWSGSGADIYADAGSYGIPGYEAVRRFSESGNTNIVNGAGLFPVWATAAGAKLVGGDFNGDGRTDLALVGGSGWTNIKLAFSNGNGTFAIMEAPLWSFPTFATQGTEAVAGDFNHDGLADIALFGGAGWTTIPVAFSNGNGSFYERNYGSPDFASNARQFGAKVVSGNFDGVGGDDLAATGGVGWNTIPVAQSNGDGTFVFRNEPSPDFASYAQTGLSSWAPGPRVTAGDFDGDGDTDLALTGGPGWATVPIAFSNGNSSFTTTNQGVRYFPSWPSMTTKVVASDFDADGRADLALTGEPSWITIPFAFSTGGGNFTAGTLPHIDAPQWGAAARFAVAGRFLDRPGAGKRDLALVGGTGWASVPIVSIK